jgi:transcriptional regulator with XRE-family HTH domain
MAKAAKLCFMAGTTGGTPRARALGAKLRHHREARFDGTLREFADYVDIDHSVLSRWENGGMLPSSEQVANLAGALRIIGEEKEALIEEAKAARNPDWLAPGVDRQVSAIIEFEKLAHEMVSVAPLFPTGMLQTEDTIRAILAGSGFSDEQRAATVRTRMSRKEALIRSEPLQFHAYLGMRAIERPLGGTAVAIEQLRHTLKLMALPNVTVRAISETEDFNPADMGGFVLYKFKLGEPIVYFEHHRSSMFAPKRDVPDMQLAVRRIEEIAMSPDDTSGLIADVIKRMETTQ